MGRRCNCLDCVSSIYMHCISVNSRIVFCVVGWGAVLTSVTELFASVLCQSVTLVRVLKDPERNRGMHGAFSLSLVTWLLKIAHCSYEIPLHTNCSTETTFILLLQFGIKRKIMYTTMTEPKQIVSFWVLKKEFHRFYGLLVWLRLVLSHILITAAENQESQNFFSIFVIPWCVCSHTVYFWSFSCWFDRFINHHVLCFVFMGANTVFATATCPITHS